MNARDPKVTVLMPVFNGEKYLPEALESILGQTFGDFEFLIIDDGSTDRSPEIIKTYSDPRIRIVRNGTNLGLVATLNKGLKLARTEYVARMDCDDISMPERLAKQVQFLDENQDIGVLGTEYEMIDTCGTPLNKAKEYRVPQEPVLLRWNLFFWCCISHATVMVRRAVYERSGGYNADFPQAEDYELWLRLSPMIRIANLGEPLYRVRIHGKSVTSIYCQTQQKQAEIAAKRAISRALVREIPLERVRALQEPYYIEAAEEALELAAILRDLYRACTNPITVSEAARKEILIDATSRLGRVAMVCAVLDREGAHRPAMLEYLRSIVDESVLRSKEWAALSSKMAFGSASVSDVCKDILAVQALYKREHTNQGEEPRAEEKAREALRTARMLAMLGHDQFANRHTRSALRLALLAIRLDLRIFREWSTLLLVMKGLAGQRIYRIARWGYRLAQAFMSPKVRISATNPGSAPDQEAG